MPWKSKAQRAYMHIHHPRIAKRFDRETTKRQSKRLPARKGRK